jgi:hypothetical protein
MKNLILLLLAITLIGAIVLQNWFLTIGVVLFIYTPFKAHGFCIEDGDNPFTTFAPPVIGAFITAIGVMTEWGFPLMISLMGIEMAYLMSIFVGIVLFAILLIVGLFLSVMSEF